MLIWMVSLKSAFKYKKYPEITFLFSNVYGKEISLNYFRMGLKHNVSNWISASLVGF